MRKVVFVPFLFSFFVSYAQVNMSQYANDLFEVKPLVIKEIINDDEKSITEDNDEYKSQFESDLNEGLNYWSSEELDDAVDHFTNMIGVYSEIDFLFYYLGATLYDLQRYDEAKDAFYKSLKLNPLFFQSRYMLGLIAINQNEYDKAKASMDILISVESYAQYGYYGKAILASSNNNYSKAENMYAKCLKIDSTFRDAYIPLTSIYLSYAGRTNAALRLMNKAVLLDSTWQEARIARALLSTAKDNNLKVFNSDISILINQVPDNPHYRYIKAYLNIEQENYSGAVENFRTAFNLEIDTTNTGEYKFNTKLKKNKALQAGLNYYDKHIKDFDSLTCFYLDKGICEFINKDTKSSLVYFETASNRISHPVIDFFKAVTCESRWNEKDQAIRFYSNCISKDSLNFVAYDYRGDLYFGNGKNVEALNDYNKMIMLKPQLKDGYKKRGILYTQNDMYLKAYKDFTRAIFIDTTDIDLYFNRAFCAFNANYHDYSIQDVKVVLKKRPKDHEAYYLLYSNLLYKSDTIRAIQQLDSASKHGKYMKKYHEELLEIATAYNLGHKIQNAHDRLVKYYSRETQYRFNRAKYYFVSKKYDQALEDLKIVIDRKRKYAEGYYYMGKTLLALGETKAGEKSLEKAFRLGYVEAAD